MASFSSPVSIPLLVSSHLILLLLLLPFFSQRSSDNSVPRFIPDASNTFLFLSFHFSTSSQSEAATAAAASWRFGFLSAPASTSFLRLLLQFICFPVSNRFGPGLIVGSSKQQNENGLKRSKEVVVVGEKAGEEIKQAGQARDIWHIAHIAR